MNLPGDRAIAVRERVLHVLLRDRRAALHDLAALQVVDERSDRGGDVDPTVVIEVLVLRGDHGVLQHLRDVGLFDRDVGFELLVDADLVAIGVEDVTHTRLDTRPRLRQRGRQRHEDQRREHHRHGHDRREQDHHHGGESASELAKHHPQRLHAGGHSDRHRLRFAAFARSERAARRRSHADPTCAIHAAASSSGSARRT